MKTMLTQRVDARKELEQLVDKFGLSDVLALLSEICSEKELHIESNWQDHTLAKKWRKAELALDRLHVNTDI